jgi:hypothetical protein
MPERAPREIRRAPNGLVSVLDGDVALTPRGCVAAVEVDDRVFAWCAPSRPDGQSRSRPWVLEIHRAPSEPGAAWSIEAAYQIRNFDLIAWCWASRLRVQRAYRHRLVVLEARSEDFTDQAYVVLHEDGRFSEVSTKEAAEALLTQSASALAEHEGDYFTRVRSPAPLLWGRARSEYFTIHVPADAQGPIEPLLGPSSAPPRPALLGFDPTEPVVLARVGPDPSWLWGVPGFETVEHLGLDVPLVSDALFAALPAWVQALRAHPRLQTIGLGPHGPRAAPLPLTLVRDADGRVRAVLRYDEAGRRTLDHALRTYLVTQTEPVVDVVEVRGGGLDTGTFARASEVTAAPELLEATLRSVEARLDGDVLTLRRPSDHGRADPFSLEAFRAYFARNGSGGARTVRAHLRVARTAAEAFWDIVAEHGVTSLELQNDAGAIFRRGPHGWCASDGVLDVEARFFTLAGAPEPLPARVRLALSLWLHDELTEEVLGRAIASCRFHGHDATAGTFAMARPWIFEGGVSGGPKPAHPRTGKVVSIFVAGHGALRLNKPSYTKRQRRLACATKKPFEIPTPRTLAALAATVSGPVSELVLEVPRLRLRWLLAEWAELGASRGSLGLSAIERVALRTPEGSSELRYDGSEVHASLCLEHLAGAAAERTEAMAQLPARAFERLTLVGSCEASLIEAAARTARRLETVPSR